MTFSTREWENYLGRFSLAHLASYILAGGVYLTLLNALDLTHLEALTFFDPYTPISIPTVITQLLRGVVLGLIFYPFYRVVVRNNRHWVVLFIALWGLSVIGSIQPYIGSIEGVIYTETSAVAHLFFLAVSGFQYGILTIGLWVVTDREQLRGLDSTTERGLSGIVSARFGGYLTRFTVVYVLVYLSAGIAFMMLQDYETVLAMSEQYQLFRPLDHQLVQIAPLIQFGRGALLALCIYPIYDRVFRENRGYLTLFVVLWGGTFLASPTIIDGFIADLFNSGTLADLVFGTAEITVQMIAFVVVFWLWQTQVSDSPGLVYRTVSKVVG